MSNDILHITIEKEFENLLKTGHLSLDVPNYITDNLSHPLRPYQEQALRQFIYTQQSNTANISFNHLLFHMATGSGKTLVLAGTILYLFKEKGHQNFIFFVNSDAIIKKTYDNLTNTASSKYLFRKDGIVIDGEFITIQVVDVFPFIPADNTIYLKLTTIQKLHMDLTDPRENGLTYDSLENMKLVLLADEAHHINVLTRSDKRKLTTQEEQEKTWEYTVNKLLKINPENRLLEFTATIDLNNDGLFHKYSNKIVYQYDLKKFMENGFSKNVVLLRANEDDEKKMLHAMLLSQYRKYVAKENDIDLKPIILFKSNKIAISLQANETFLSIVENLTISHLQNVIHNGQTVYQNQHSIWHKMFQYYSQQDLEQVIRDLQWDFTRETILNANDSSFLSENNAILLNTLEDSDNPIRAIFAVAKLNEGWDVLNLFDIVRISEGASGTKKTTDSEAQLIGRGARYYPFKYKGKKSDTRRFDYEASDLKVIETLHYHTINENVYIKNLEKSLESANIQVREDHYTLLQAKIKPNIRKMDFFRYGKIYINRVIPTTPEEYQKLESYNVSRIYETDLVSSIEKVFGKKEETYSGTKKHEETLQITRPLLQKALQRNKFYRFNNLKNFVPSISSVKEFIESPNFLGDIRIIVSLPYGVSVNDLSPKDKLKIVDGFLSYVEKTIRLNYMKEKGTPVFEGVAFPTLIDDYVVEISKVTNSYVNEVKNVRNMRNYDWFIYDKAIVNRLENNFLDYIMNYIEELKSKYNDVYLIRNEKKVKIVEINGTRGFMPDFLLYLKDENCTYQVFLEPKGKHLLVQDKWKQDFLLSLSNNPNIEILAENESVRLIGIKFYTDNPDLKNEFREDFIEKLLTNSRKRGE